ncbi:MAG: iron-sulfur cluster insertion protein ErpA [Candidatus Omnitrophota bacterium]|jgi:iron-sulfur cluster assembly protein|nr:MAG: iron-sulfur cluster insertion protein ErpA [Candidatus Omnitrophota bacterium]
MITLTEKAIHEVKRLIEAQNLPEDTGLRVGVRGGGCSGLSYSLNFETEQKENDQIFDTDGVKVIVDAKSYQYLAGTTLDYSDGLNGSGFTFNNPNACQSCGCGSSFSA